MRLEQLATKHLGPLLALMTLSPQIGCGSGLAGAAESDDPSFTAAATAARRPFPQHTAYAAGTIRPNHVSQAQLDSAVRSYYDAWKARYIRQTGSNQFYVRAQVWQPDAVSVSEGHGYGMVIVAMMAGHDPDAQTLFDGMYRFFRAHPAYSTQLMGWYQKQSGSTIVDGDRWNATDGDLDIAFSLLLADQQWGSGGSINYLQEARNVIGAIMQTDINRTYWTTMRGDTGQQDQTSRPSDYMLDHIRAFRAATGDARWDQVLNKLISVISTVQTQHSPSAGLVPDFVVNVGSTPRPASPGAFEGPNDGQYYWNACRVPWRLGADLVTSGDSRVATLLGRMNSFFRARTGEEPRNIAAGYRLDGSVISQWQTLAFIAPLGVAAMAGAQNQTWLNRLWDRITSMGFEGYFGDAIKMQVLIIMSGNWWSPQLAPAAAPAPMPPPSPSPGLPAPWRSADVGAVGVAGSATHASGLFTVKASGTDIWGVSDQFHYVYQPLSGNTEVVARVASLQNTAPWAQAGIMIRETLAPNSRHAFMMVSAQNGTNLDYRTTTGGSTNETYQGYTGAAPMWLKLVRSGNTFTGYRSRDGVSWTLQASVTVPMATNVYVGLALSSLNNGVLNTATFDNVRVGP